MTLLARALSCHYHGYGGRGQLLQSRSSLFPPQSRAFQPPSSSPFLSYPRTSNVYASSQVIWNQVDIREKQGCQGASTVSNGFSMQSARRLPIRTLITILVITVVSPAFLCGCAHAAEALKASSLGLKVASFLRGTGWPDEAIVFLMAMLPVLELRGAIPVGYWMQLDPFKLSILSVLGVELLLIIFYGLLLIRRLATAHFQPVSTLCSLHFGCCYLRFDTAIWFQYLLSYYIWKSWQHSYQTEAQPLRRLLTGSSNPPGGKLNPYRSLNG